jgi:heptosyltransferase-2
VAEKKFRRALVIRGGALGDFLLTLPVISALREAAPDSRLEVLAYPGIASLAVSGGLVDAARSIEYGPLAGFFTRGAVLDPALREYFASFDLILSYLYDPDGIFSENLRTAGVKCLLTGPHRPSEKSHAIDQLAAPLIDLQLPLGRRATRLNIVPTKQGANVVALHPGSGSPAKNWPAGYWRQVMEELLADNPSLQLAIVGGEADSDTLGPLRHLDTSAPVTFWENLPLPDLASNLAGARFYLGHDTGVSHLAAVAGLPSLLLFGPTDPGIWAPPHDHVRVLCAPGRKWENLTPDAVLSAVSRVMNNDQPLTCQRQGGG